MLELNVLPPSEKKNASYEVARLLAVRLGARFLFLILVFTALLAPSYFLTVFQQSNVLLQTELLHKDPRIVRAVEVEKEVVETNARMRSLKNYVAGNPSFSQNIETLVSGAGGVIVINSLRLDTKTKRLEIDGFSERRQDLLAAIRAYEAYPFVAKVESPIANLVRDSNSPFRLIIVFR